MDVVEEKAKVAEEKKIVEENSEEVKEKSDVVIEKAEAWNGVEHKETKKDRIKKILSQLTGIKSTLSNLAVAEQIKVDTYFSNVFSLLHNHICL